MKCYSVPTFNPSLGSNCSRRMLRDQLRTYCHLQRTTTLLVAPKVKLRVLLPTLGLKRHLRTQLLSGSFRQYAYPLITHELYMLESMAQKVKKRRCSTQHRIPYMDGVWILRRGWWRWTEQVQSHWWYGTPVMSRFICLENKFWENCSQHRSYPIRGGKSQRSWQRERQWSRLGVSQRCWWGKGFLQ